MNKNLEKKVAAVKAAEFIEDGMILGLGTGSTVKYLIEELAQKVNSGLTITAVSTSQRSAELASSLGINVIEIDKVKQIDLTIDGADEFDRNLNGIKGGGGALLYEKIVASHSKENIWITDSGKFVKQLGKFPLPVEVVPFGARSLFDTFEHKGYNPKFREKNGKLFITDGNHYIIDLHLNAIESPLKLNTELNSIPGVIETGLFIDVADIVIMGKGEGYEIFKKKKADHN